MAHSQDFEKGGWGVGWGGGGGGGGGGGVGGYSLDYLCIITPN